MTMPYKTSSEATRRDSQAVIDQLGVRTVDVPITDQIDAYFAQFPDASQLRLANKCARERMTVLYDQSAAFGGPGGRHEQQERTAPGLRHAVRRHGLGHQSDRRSLQDAALSIWPPIWACPSRFCARSRPATCGSGRPTRANWASPTPRSIGCWCLMVDRRWRRAELLQAGFAAEFVDRVTTMIRRNHYKRRMPVIAKLSHRTMDRDFRYARDWGT